MSVLHAELERMNGENKRLKEMLNQVTANYSALQMHAVSLMQNQNSESEGVEEIKKNKNIINNENGSGGAILIPRQFMDLGVADTDNEPSLSSEERRSASAGNNCMKNENGDHHQEYKQVKKAIVVREESQDQLQFQGWGPNNNVPSNDQAEASIMKKARVSVRARTEALMVYFLI